MTPFFLCVAAATTALLVAPSQSSAMTGIKLDPQPPWTARVEEVIDGNWVGRCSGTLVAPRTVLTAGHCLSGYESAIGRARLDLTRFSVVIHGRRFMASRTGVHRDYLAQTTVAKKLLNGSPDIGYLSLRTSATAFSGISPAPIATAAELESFRGKSVSVFGYGRFHPEISSMARFARKSPDHAWSLGVSCEQPPSLCFALAPEFHKTTQILGGDSGGPWMGYIGQRWKVLAVLSGHSRRSPWVHVAAALSEPRIASWLSTVVRRDSGLSALTRSNKRGNDCRAKCRAKQP